MNFKRFKSFGKAEAYTEKNNCSIAIGSNGYTDIYYAIPNDLPNGIYKVATRSQGDMRGKQFMYRVIYKSNEDIHLVEATSEYRISQVALGKVKAEKVIEYLRGYYTLMEEKSEKIKMLKETARISHQLCDMGGKAGHEIRQQLRQELRNKC